MFADLLLVTRSLPRLALLVGRAVTDARVSPQSKAHLAFAGLYVFSPIDLLPEMLLGELELYVPWMLWLAEIAPEIEIGNVTAQAVESGAAADSPVGMELLVTVEVRNAGYLPTNLTQRALDAQIAEAFGDASQRSWPRREMASLAIPGPP